MRTTVPMLMLLMTAAAWARVGGGQSYSGGGGGGYSGGGGDGDGALIGLLLELAIRLIFYYPQVGIPLLVGAAVLWYKSQSRSASAYEVSRNWSHQATPVRHGSSPASALPSVDARFSRPLFLDFVNLLYSRVQQERTTDLARLAAYLSPDVRKLLGSQTAQSGTKEVRDVIVGSIRLVRASTQGPMTSVEVALETNYTEVGADGSARPIYSVETWTLSRRTGALSKNPDEILKLACPNCGSPSELSSDGVCPHCDTRVDDGRFGWLVRGIWVSDRRERPQLSLSKSGEEVGTELPTRYSPDFELRRKEFLVRDPQFQWPAFEARVRTTFLALQEAWSNLSPEKGRPYETDHLFESHRYWIEAYRREGLQNRLEDIKIHRAEAVRIETDAYYDAVTVRIWAGLKDYTVRVSDGSTVGGDPHKPREFSEYWTFIRRTGHTSGQSRDPDRCPSCGAPLDGITMAGVCSYCGSKITRGDFDWVLSRIEQDEAYEP